MVGHFQMSQSLTLSEKGIHLQPLSSLSKTQPHYLLFSVLRIKGRIKICSHVATKNKKCKGYRSELERTLRYIGSIHLFSKCRIWSLDRKWLQSSGWVTSSRIRTCPALLPPVCASLGLLLFGFVLFCFTYTSLRFLHFPVLKWYFHEFLKSEDEKDWNLEGCGGRQAWWETHTCFLFPFLLSWWAFWVGLLPGQLPLKHLLA